MFSPLKSHIFAALPTQDSKTIKFCNIRYTSRIWKEKEFTHLEMEKLKARLK